MTPNPLIGVFFHWLGCLASASFYVPYKKIRLWSWEIFWLTGGIFSWLIAPWIFAYFQTSDLFGVLGAASPTTWFWCVFWGLLWGFGGLTFGLAGSKVTDGYVCQVSYSRGAGTAPIVKQARHAIHTTLGASAAPGNAVKADSPDAAVTLMTRQVISQALRDLALDAAFP